MKLVISFLGLFAVVSTAPSTYTNALNFKFVAYLKTEMDLYPSIQHYELTYDLSRSNSALLTPQSFTEDTYYGNTVNGTYFDSKHSIATIWTDDSKYAINISPKTKRDALGRRPVIFSEKGQAGVGVVPWPGIEPILYFDGCVFYACPVENLGVQFFCRDISTETTPSGCAEVALLAECVKNGTVHPLATDAYCCLNVTARHCRADLG